jgi:hypothetical protein
VKNRFQNLPFKFNLHRYNEVKHMKYILTKAVRKMQRKATRDAFDAWLTLVDNATRWGCTR